MSFDKIAARYDLLYGERDDDLEMWLTLSAEVQGELLEVGCGTGRILVPMAQYDRSITGIDISARAIEICQSKVQLAGLSQHVFLQQADMRTLALDKTDFAFAFIPINTFMHCETLADQKATLQSIYDHLKPEGILAIDLYNPTPQRLLEADSQLILERQEVDDVTGNLMQWFVCRHLYPAEQVEDVTFILDEIPENGVLTRETLTFALRYLHRFEMVLLLTQAGFQIQEILGDYDLSAYDDHSARLIFVARKSLV